MRGHPKGLCRSIAGGITAHGRNPRGLETTGIRFADGAAHLFPCLAGELACGYWPALGRPVARPNESERRSARH